MFNSFVVVSHIDGDYHVELGFCFGIGDTTNYLCNNLHLLDYAMANSSCFPTNWICCWLDCNYIWLASSLCAVMVYDFDPTMDIFSDRINKWTFSCSEDSWYDDKVQLP